MFYNTLTIISNNTHVSVQDMFTMALRQQLSSLHYKLQSQISRFIVRNTRMKENRTYFTLSSFCRPVYHWEGPVTDEDLLLITEHHTERISGVKGPPLLLNDKYHVHVAVSTEYHQPRKGSCNMEVYFPFIHAHKSFQEMHTLWFKAVPVLCICSHS